MMGNLYFIYSSTEVTKIGNNIDKDWVMDYLFNMGTQPLSRLPKHYHFEKIDDETYALYLTKSAGARASYYFSTLPLFGKVLEEA